MGKRRHQWNHPPTHRLTATDFDWCPDHRKLSYPSRRDAKLACRDSHVRNLRPYKCTVSDGYFHIGHIAPDVVRGIITTGDLYLKRCQVHNADTYSTQGHARREMRKRYKPGMSMYTLLCAEVGGWHLMEGRNPSV